jgi:hypothetical protein
MLLHASTTRKEKGSSQQHELCLLQRGHTKICPTQEVKIFSRLGEIGAQRPTAYGSSESAAVGALRTSGAAYGIPSHKSVWLAITDTVSSRLSDKNLHKTDAHTHAHAHARQRVNRVKASPRAPSVHSGLPVVAPRLLQTGALPQVRRRDFDILNSTFSDAQKPVPARLIFLPWQISSPRPAESLMVRRSRHRRPSPHSRFSNSNPRTSSLSQRGQIPLPIFCESHQQVLKWDVHSSIADLTP